MKSVAVLLATGCVALICNLAIAVAQPAPPAGPQTPVPLPRVQPAATPAEGPEKPVRHPPSANDICHAVERSAAQNNLPVEFFARVIWQESRFNAGAVSPK